MIKKIKNIINSNYEAILMSLILLISIFSFFQNLSSIFTTAILILICFIISTKYICFEKKKIQLKINKEINKITFIMVLFCIYVFLSSKIIGDTQNFITLNSNLFIILTMALIINESFSCENIHKPIITYNLIMTILLILCIVLNIDNINRGVMKFFSYKYDPNYMCSSFLLLFFFQIKFLFAQVNKFRYLNIIIIILFVFLCLLCGSRGITLAALFGTIIYVLLNFLKKCKKPKKVNIKKVLIFVVIALIIIILFKYIIPESTLDRFKIKNMLSFGGRSGIWKKSLQTFLSAPLANKLIGYGMGSFVSAVQYFNYGMYLMSHNVIINLLIETGIIGIILFIIMIYFIFKQQKENKNYFGICLTISTLLLYLTLDMNLNFWINIVISSLILNSKKVGGD